MKRFFYKEIDRRYDSTNIDFNYKDLFKSIASSCYFKTGLSTAWQKK